MSSTLIIAKGLCWRLSYHALDRVQQRLGLSGSGAFQELVAVSDMVALVERAPYEVKNIPAEYWNICSHYLFRPRDRDLEFVVIIGHGVLGDTLTLTRP
jgi:hypothetical protein